jgi:hypothetical protein
MGFVPQFGQNIAASLKRQPPVGQIDFNPSHLIILFALSKYDKRSARVYRSGILFTGPIQWG